MLITHTDMDHDRRPKKRLRRTLRRPIFQPSPEQLKALGIKVRDYAIAPVPPGTIRTFAYQHQQRQPTPPSHRGGLKRENTEPIIVFDDTDASSGSGREGGEGKEGTSQ